MRALLLFWLICFLGMPAAVSAGESGRKSLSSSMEVYVIPKEGHQAEQQSKDEYSCYEWATTNTGSDPFELNKQSVAQGRGNRKGQSGG